MGKAIPIWTNDEHNVFWTRAEEQTPDEALRRVSTIVDVPYAIAEVEQRDQRWYHLTPA